ncbi:MAG: DUF2141 domain-containing protein [Bacteroidia bacterium]|nr:DUF2141 domain-containing protein [Bacteroidia bacterium]
MSTLHIVMVIKFMIRFVCFLILLIPSVCFSQSDLLLAKSFRTRDLNDKHTLFLENESSPLPGIDEATYSITITVTNIRNQEGVIRFKFYDDATPFPHDKGFLRIVVPKSEVVNNTYTATYYGFTSKEMGIALQDDENSNKILDMGWFFPKEGHAFSDYYHSSLRRPVYSDFRFLLTGDKEVVMKMKYY